MNCKSITALCACMFFVSTECTFARTADVVGGFESFEGVQVGGNIVAPHNVYLRIIGPVTFASGVSLTGPFPQSNPDRAIVINDFVRGGGYGLADNGDINTSAPVPDGEAFLAAGEQDDFRPFEFTFPLEMRRVSVLVTGSDSRDFPNPDPPGNLITMTAYDVLGNELASSSIESVHATEWGHNLLEVRAPGIHRVTIGGYLIVMDSLRFSPVPECSTLVLGGMSLFCLMVFNWRREFDCL